MGIEIIIGAIIAAIAGIFGAKAYGKSKGRAEANATRDKADAIREVDAAIKTADAQVKVAQNATTVQNEVNSLNDGDALSELRRIYARENRNESN